MFVGVVVLWLGVEVGEDVFGLLSQLAFEGFIVEVEPQGSGGGGASGPVSLLE